MIAPEEQPAGSHQETGRSQLDGPLNEILSFLSKAYTHKEIVDKMNISVSTGRAHLCHIFEKLQVRLGTEAIL